MTPTRKKKRGEREREREKENPPHGGEKLLTFPGDHPWPPKALFELAEMDSPGTSLLCEGPGNHSLLLPEEWLCCSEKGCVALSSLSCEEETEHHSVFLHTESLCSHRC